MGRTNHRPNTALHALVTEAGCPYERLAALVNAVGREAGALLNYRAPSVCQWLDGARPRDPVPAYLAEALARRLGRPVLLADIGMAPPGKRPGRTDTALAWDTDPATALADLGRDLVERRTFLTHSAYTLAAAANIPHWPEIADRGRLAASTPGTRIGAGDVAAVRQMTRLFDHVADQRGSGHIRETATTYLTREVAAYLRADAPTGIRRDLHTAASHLAYLCAWYAWDDEKHALAQRQYQAALKLAAAADDRPAYATALRGMAIQATGLGHHNAAAHMADHAVTATRDAEPRTRAFTLAALAIAAAGQRDRRAAHTHLAATDRALEKATAGLGTTGRFHGASLGYTAALTHQALGDTRDAEKAMAHSTRQRLADERRHRAVANSILAELRLDLGLLEQACDTWNLVLDDAEQLRCGQLDTAITTMRSKLRPHARHRAAAALLERNQPAI